MVAKSSSSPERWYRLRAATGVAEFPRIGFVYQPIVRLEEWEPGLAPDYRPIGLAATTMLVLGDTPRSAHEAQPELRRQWSSEALLELSGFAWTCAADEAGEQYDRAEEPLLLVDVLESCLDTPRAFLEMASEVRDMAVPRLSFAVKERRDSPGLAEAANSNRDEFHGDISLCIDALAPASTVDWPSDYVRMSLASWDTSGVESTDEVETAMSQSVGADRIASGASAEQVASLRRAFDHGITLFQGPLFVEPKPIDQIVRYTRYPIPGFKLDGQLGPPERSRAQYRELTRKKFSDAGLTDEEASTLDRIERHLDRFDSNDPEERKLFFEQRRELQNRLLGK